MKLLTFVAVAYAQIDWHDFVVVETVEYQPSETGNLPPPTTPDEVGARLLQQQRFDDGVVTVNFIIFYFNSSASELCEAEQSRLFFNMCFAFWVQTITSFVISCRLLSNYKVFAIFL